MAMIANTITAIIRGTGSVMTQRVYYSVHQLSIVTVTFIGTSRPRRF